MKRIFIILGTMIAALLSCYTAFAADGLDYDLSVNQDSKIVSVNMSLEGDLGGTAATGLVVNDEGNVVYIAQGFTDENGEFSFSYINNDENGSYTLTVSAPRKGLSESSSFKMVTNSMKTAMSQSTKDASGMQSIIENYGSYMNIDTTAFDALSDKNAVYSFMAGDSMIDLNSVASIADGFYGAVIVRTIAEGGDSTDYLDFLNSDVYSVLNKNGIPIGKNASLFDELAPDVKNGVLEKVLSKKYSSASELSSTLGFYVLEQSMEKALLWTEINPVMVKYKDAGLLNVNFTSYNGLKKPQDADSAMMGKSFATYTEIESAFNSAVTTALSAQSTSSSHGGGGGGGGGGGFVIPSVVIPEPVEKPEQPTKAEAFTDMANYMWANEAVTYLVEKGIINGMGDGIFAPAKGLTREEISAIMVRTQKLDMTGKTSAFIDVPENKWSYPYVSAVFEKGLMIGVSDDMFGATSLITRNEFAVIMKRLIDLYDVELKVNPSTAEYDDAAQIPEWAIESVKYMKLTGLMLGNTGNTFAGNEIVSRAYACDVLYNVLTAVNYDSEE